VRFPCVTHLLVLCRDEEEAKEAITHVKEILDELELTLHPEKTKIKNFSEGVDFLGFTVYISHKVPRKEAVKIANVNWLYMRLDGWTRMRLRAFLEKKKSYLSNTRIRNDFLKNLGLKSLSTNLSLEKKALPKKQGFLVT
jgi:RNA-directed DNA polymerase